MQGIQYVTNAKGRRIAVMIDLHRHGEMWEDFYDVLTTRLRASEPRESLSSVKKRLRKLGKLKMPA